VILKTDNCDNMMRQRHFVTGGATTCISVLGNIVMDICVLIKPIKFNDGF